MIKEYIRNYIIRSAIVGSLYFLGNDFNFSTNLSSKDTFDNYINYNAKKINKENFNALDEIIKGDSSFYSENLKTQEYQIKPNLGFKYNRKI